MLSGNDQDQGRRVVRRTDSTSSRHPITLAEDNRSGRIDHFQTRREPSGKARRPDDLAAIPETLFPGDPGIERTSSESGPSADPQADPWHHHARKRVGRWFRGDRRWRAPATYNDEARQEHPNKRCPPHEAESIRSGKNDEATKRAFIGPRLSDRSSDCRSPTSDNAFGPKDESRIPAASDGTRTPWYRTSTCVKSFGGGSRARGTNPTIRWPGRLSTRRLAGSNLGSEIPTASRSRCCRA